MHIMIPDQLTVHTLPSVINGLLPISKTIANLTFDFSETVFVRPGGLAGIVALISYCNYMGVQDISIIEPNQDVQCYLERMDFYKRLGIDKNLIWRRNSLEKQLCELKEITDGNDSYCTTIKLRGILEAQGIINNDLLDAVSDSVGEIIDNIAHHSESPVNGYVCSQLYKHVGKLEIAIVDCGKGIKKSLTSYPKFTHITDDNKAIIVATGKGTTSRPENNTGQGLFIVRQALQANEGFLYILSGNGKVKFGGNRVSPYWEEYNIPYWQGTIVVLEFNLNKPVKMKDIYDSEFGYDEDIEDLNKLFEGEF